MPKILRDNAWFVALVIAILLSYLLGSAIAPFLVGAILAYILNPVASALVARGWRRSWAAAPLVALTFVLIFGASALLIPILIVEAGELAGQLPRIYEAARNALSPALQPWLERAGIEGSALGEEALNVSRERLRDLAAALGKRFFVLLDILFLAFLTPFVTFFLLRDWPAVLKQTRRLLPRRSQLLVTRLARDVDQRLAGMLRGQLLVCAIQGVYHTAGLLALGLKGAVLVGVLTGILNFIPVIGNVTMFVVALALAAVQFDSVARIALVVVLYGSSQLLEDSLLYPKLVGERVRLHPLWIIFSLLVGGAVFGLVGAILALPAACIVAVLARHFTRTYMRSRFYRRPA